MWEIWEQSPDPNGLPRAPIKAMLFVGLGLLLLRALAEMVKLIAVLTGHARFGQRTVHGGPIRSSRREATRWSWRGWPS